MILEIFAAICILAAGMQLMVVWGFGWSISSAELEELNNIKYVLFRTWGYLTLFGYVFIAGWIIRGIHIFFETT